MAVRIWTELTYTHIRQFIQSQVKKYDFSAAVIFELSESYRLEEEILEGLDNYIDECFHQLVSDSFLQKKNNATHKRKEKTRRMLY